ncbi:hypothetical protein [Candidatus Thiodictyon syntrophicum]|uniref:Uncharacterized protein n=1 Tax=Candidatus Thiodictyon syntrophicum TaxID=1166950 RepID=A0A2K8U6Y7_9GAMM|nr:hypothetical protein [Candidatus Thiodictyon syntrophicum]AUB81333.1 hypothetical protein THSYN_10475 [Candidatus Thiodictyon syntrophicum]
MVNLLIAPALLWSLVLARRRLSYRCKAVLFILCLWGLAINALTMVGPVANAKAVIILNVLLSVLFLSPRAGWSSRRSPPAATHHPDPRVPTARTSSCAVATGPCCGPTPV